MSFPHRNCSHRSNRLHRSASVRHSESVDSTPQEPFAQHQEEEEEDQDTPQAAMRSATPASESLSAILAGLSSAGSTMDSTPCPTAAHHHNHTQVAPQSTSPIHANLENDSSVPSLPTPGILVPETPLPFPHPGPLPLVQSSTARICASLASLKARLEASTALVRNLQTRNLIQEADNERMKLSYAEDEMVLKVLKVALGVVLVAVVGYAVVCWYQGPEMEYIRMRRREELGI